jgi:hypothetical protein
MGLKAVQERHRRRDRSHSWRYPPTYTHYRNGKSITYEGWEKMDDNGQLRLFWPIWQGHVQWGDWRGGMILFEGEAFGGRWGRFMPGPPAGY